MAIALESGVLHNSGHRGVWVEKKVRASESLTTLSNTYNAPENFAYSFCSSYSDLNFQTVIYGVGAIVGIVLHQ